MAATKKRSTPANSAPTWPPRSCYQGVSATDYHRYTALVVRQSEPAMRAVSTGHIMVAR